MTYTVETVESQTRVTDLVATDIIGGVRGAPTSPFDMSFTAATLAEYINENVTAGATITFGSDRTTVVSPGSGDLFFDTDDGIIYQYIGVAWVSKIDYVVTAELTAAITGLVTTAQLTTAISTHAAAADPHPTYLTQAEGDGRYPLSSALSESIDDRVSALLVAGSNITLTYNDTANTLTIASTVSSGSGAASGIQYTYSTTAGTGIISAATLSTATTLTINTTDAQAKAAADVLARIKTGTIFEVRESATKWVRYEATADYASGSVNVSASEFLGAIASTATVYLSILSDAPSVGGGSGFSSGAISASAAGSSAILAESVAASGSWAPYTYNWYRSNTANFTLAQGALVAGASGNTLTQNGLAADNYYYRRVAVDQLGIKAPPTPEVGVEIAAGSYDTDAITAFNAVAAAGVTLTVAQKSAANTRIIAHKTSGTWTALRALYLYLGGTAAAHGINWKNPGIFDLAWAGGLTHDANGVTSNGTGYGLGGMPAVAAHQNSNATAGYLKTANANGYLHGASTNEGNDVIGIYVFASGANSHTFYTNSPADSTPNTVTRTGALLASRTVSTEHKFFRNGVLEQTSSRTSAAGQNGGQMAVMTQQTHSGGFPGPLNGTVASSAFFDRGLTDAEAIAFTNADLAYQTELGRN